ncbi:MAG: 2-dehydropantoate 2-reductase [Nitrospinota bacterium]
MSRVAVVGAGAIGGVYGVRLCAGHEVVFCVRAPFERLVVETPSGVIEAPARCATGPGQVGRVDWVLLAVKGHQTAGAADWLKALAGPGTIVGVMQNGVEQVERTAPHANGAEVLPMVVNCPADRLGPGRMKQNLHAGLQPPDGRAGRALAQLFEGTDIQVAPVQDIATALWTKLCQNIAGGPMTALTGQPRGVLRRPEVAEIARALVRECAEAGRAAGAKLPGNIHETAVATVQNHPLRLSTSMLQDRLAGRPLEADPFTGAVIRFGEKHGVPTPVTRIIHPLLMALNGGGEAGPGA